MTTHFRAFVVREQPDKTFQGTIEAKAFDDLPKNDLLIRVIYSSINYKDALSANGNRGITRNYPHTPGIDAAGIVVESTHPTFKVGDKVIVCGGDLGMNTAGGFAEYIAVPHTWAIKLPRGLSLHEAMMYGTAGLTAALSVDKLLKNGLTPTDGKVIVTGATGGVGSMAIAILSKLGFQVVALSGKPTATEFLTNIGASAIIAREAMNDASGKLLLKPQFAGAIDTVGGNILATILKSMNYGGSVAATGMVNAGELNTTVFPFILKGVTLFGIDSVVSNLAWREQVWKKMAKLWKPAQLKNMTTTINIEDLAAQLQQIAQGQMCGRVVVIL
jgi:acrylyl-CoA reductase (NADPH)